MSLIRLCHEHTGLSAPWPGVARMDTIKGAFVGLAR
jgi:hypothetical protein